MQSSKILLKDGQTVDLVDGRIADGDITSWNSKMDRQTVGNVSEPVYLENGIAKVATNVVTDGKLNAKLNVDGSNATTEGVTAMMKKVSSGTDDLNDDSTYFGDSNADHTHIVRRPVLDLWNYIKGKISSVLGLTSSAYSGKAATAGTADKAVADKSGNDIETTYATKSETEAAISNSVDQTYSSTSTKAQSGVSVNEAFKTRETSGSGDSYTYLGMKTTYKGTEAVYWKLVSFNAVNNYWTLQFELDVSNGRKGDSSYDTEIYETKRLTICGANPESVYVAIELRYTAQGLDANRGYGNNIYYEIGSSNLVTVYIKAIDRANKTQVCRLKDVINFKGISNITWYEPVSDAGTQPTNPIKFKEVFPAIASTSFNLGSESVPVYVNNGKPRSCNTSNLKAGKDDDGNVIKNTYAKKTELDAKLNVDGSNATNEGVTTMMKKVSSGTDSLNDESTYFGDSNSDHTHIVRRPILNLWNYFAYKVDDKIVDKLGSVGSDETPIYLENGVPKVCTLVGVPFSFVNYGKDNGYGVFVGGNTKLANTTRCYCTFLVSLSSNPDLMQHTYIGTFSFRGDLSNKVMTKELKCLTGTPAYPLRIAVVYNEDGKDSNGKPTYTVGLFVIPADKSYKFSTYRLTRIASSGFKWDVKIISSTDYDNCNAVSKPSLRPIILTWDAAGSNVTKTGGTWLPTFDKATKIDCRGIVDMSIQVDLSIIGQTKYIDTLSSYEITLVNSSKTDILNSTLHQTGRMPRQTKSSTSGGTIDISHTHRFIFPITSTTNLIDGYMPKIMLPSNYTLDSGAQVSIKALCRGIVLPYGEDAPF